MLQALCHLWGDYIFQNSWMANKKTLFTFEGWMACLIHCITYTLPFLLITTDPLKIFIIFSTHFVIDKFRLAKYFCQFKNWQFTPTGFSQETPAFIATWLLFIVDNIIHVTINYITINYL